MSDRTKIKLGNGMALNFIPKAYSFSDIESRLDDDGKTFDVGDNGMEVDKIFKKLEYENLILQVLFNLNNTEKIIFLYVMLRDYGLQIDHASFAKTMGIKRVNYMYILGKMKKKVLKIVNQEANKQDD
jgi:hypothetical protein